ncbi:MAG: alpha/beta hydrolase fold domain-containing protein [Rhizobiales bacterium]|nr:alpha/beta hydrolase fold domain-containing protein [Hyphomicrobiales bacterium]
MTDTLAAPRTKGPIVWMDMDQTELDNAYDQAVYASNQPLVQARRNAANARAKARLGAAERFQYGASEIEGIDIYRTRDIPDNAPINVYIHGGAWRNGRCADFAFLSEMIVDAGAHSVIVDFNNIDDVGGNLMTMAKQVRSAVAWVYNNAQKFGGDKNRLTVTGHSSGSHLTSTIVTCDWQKDFGLPKDIVKGAMLASGMYDLKPVRLSKRSKYVNFTDEIEEELSAIRHLDRLNCPIVVAYGTQETPEFQRQARDFAAAVKAAGKPITFIVGEGYNHFEIQETLASPYGLLGREVLKLMKLD